VFGIDQSPVNDDVEDSAASFDQLRVNSRCFSNCIRQTGGLRGVVSLHAVGNADFHPESPAERNVDCQNLTMPKHAIASATRLPHKLQCRAMIEFCRDIVSLASVRFGS
jgi:hypothetical protein